MKTVIHHHCSAKSKLNLLSQNDTWDIQKVTLQTQQNFLKIFINTFKWKNS